MTKPQRIEPRTLKGFRDYPPEVMIPRERLMETARKVYRSYGYAPIDTPALEYLEILTGKGSDETDKQLYRFKDHGGRDVGLRFDLTVPLARFAAQHAQQLGLPFKRYHIAPVWRGENTQRGRYREFVQCDFDTVGTTALASDIETVLVIHDLMRAIGFERFTIRVNHRGVLNGLLETLGLAECSTEVLRALDKLTKMGADKVRAELAATAGASDEQSDKLLAFAGVTGSAEEVLAIVGPLVAGSERGEASVTRLYQVLAGFTAAGAEADRLRIDPSIARGLDYYTGLVLETTLDDLPDIGSVASGGRYDDLAGLYTNQTLPGIGASLGVDRLLAAMEELGLVGDARTPADALVVFFAEDRLGDYLKLAASLRTAGVGAELYPDAKKLGVQLKYADKKGFRLAVIAGPDELARGECQIKSLATGESTTVPLNEAPATALKLL
ncbi:histidine--tRNA ligase [Botrimarina mediterranea]|uniref:Histidine--tRNA ligase n=1 Tax=Botrimarina mediterranea TaxID=2528022 RepID=A0A518KEC2_9BACT|nr:histidine--tRNA ligase [Botrimarina mediterranea]QDV76146.1 Histidine--tRNA ligase [Botrimarina mediterranea]QDV80743.1 Histidine--tRNA ligase [Planctomycetes bacterium K2D]